MVEGSPFPPAALLRWNLHATIVENYCCFWQELYSWLRVRLESGRSAVVLNVKQSWEKVRCPPAARCRRCLWFSLAISSRFSCPCRQSQVSNTKGRAPGEEENSQGPCKEESFVQQAVRPIFSYLFVPSRLIHALQIRQRHHPAAGWQAANVSSAFRTLALFRGPTSGSTMNQENHA